MSASLYIAAKTPLPGQAKTRLSAEIGERGAIDLYRAFLRDLGARFADGPLPLSWYVTPGAWPEIAPLLGASAADARVLTQPAGDWTERQRSLFRLAAENGEAPIVLIGSDSPQVRREVVAEALELLACHDLVFGPTLDGGYWLIGMRAWHDVLEGIAMSVPGVLERIVARARAAGLSVALVETTFDVDEACDLAALAHALRGRGDLRATSAALRALELVRTESAA